MSAIPRLYLDHPFAPGQAVALTEAQSNYLFAVLRLRPAMPVWVFNGRDGDWLAEVQAAGKRGGSLILRQPGPAQVNPPDLWLVFAPLKKARTDMLVEKAVELGVARLLPVLTERTGADRVRQDKMQAHAIEAAEQCGATHVPGIAAPQRLDRLLAAWDPARALIWCDERLSGAVSAPRAMPPMPPAPAAILIGPEGGFSTAEQARLAALPFGHPLRLGPRILRAETAAMAALVLWQQARGDWR